MAGASGSWATLLIMCTHPTAPTPVAASLTASTVSPTPRAPTVPTPVATECVTSLTTPVTAPVAVVTAPHAPSPTSVVAVVTAPHALSPACWAESWAEASRSEGQ